MQAKSYVAIVVLKLSLEAEDAHVASGKLENNVSLLTAELRRHGCSIDDQDIIIARALDRGDNRPE